MIKKGIPMLDISRVENKYLVNVIDVSTLKERLGIILKEDSHNGENGYIVRSVYFDSNGNKDYRAKVDGIDNRKKIRLRIYNPDDNYIKLELKEKVNGRQRKRSISITRDEAVRMLKGDYGFLFENSDNLARTLYYYMTKEMYRPKCMIEYDRYAFIYDVNEIRITFDSNLRATLDYMSFLEHDVVWMPAGAKSHITMEVKYNEFLISGVKNAISNRMAIVTSNSKYCKARETLKY